MNLPARRLLSLLLAVVLFSLVVQPAWAREIDRKALKNGMTLPELVEAFGQPDMMEWVSTNGQTVLVVFFESKDSGVLSLFPTGGDTVRGQDGRSFLPLGFLQEGLVGWGKKFYEQIKQPK